MQIGGIENKDTEGAMAYYIQQLQQVDEMIKNLIAMLSARGEDVSSASVADCTRLIRKLFPQTSMFKFKTPSIDIVEKLLEGVADTDDAEFNVKVAQALSVFD